MSKPKTRSVSTTIRDDDYNFLKDYNLQVSAALSIGIQTLKNIFNKDQTSRIGLLDKDIELVKNLMNENRNVLKRLGETE